MIVFNNNSLEVNEGESEIIIEVDPLASDITGITEVEISTIDGSARSNFTNGSAGLDFTAIDRTVELNPNDPSTFVFPINITEDAIAEPIETFQFQVTATDDVGLNGSTTVEILDNDTDEPDSETNSAVEVLPTVSINDVEQLEGDNGNVDFEFTVSLSEPSTEIVTVDYTTVDGTAVSDDEIEGTADYLTSNGTLEFAPGTVEQTIAVEILSDTQPSTSESTNETFSVNLSDASNARLNRFVGTGTILDDDSENESTEIDNIDNIEDAETTSIQVEDSTFVEGDLVENIQQLTVNLVDNNGEPTVATQDFVFTYSTEDIDAAANLDYEFIAEETGVIESGNSSTSIELTIIGDEDSEAEESFAVNISGQETIITVQDDDEVVESNELDEDSEDSLEPEIDSELEAENTDDIEDEIEESEVEESTNTEELDLENSEEDTVNTNVDDADVETENIVELDELNETNSSELDDEDTVEAENNGTESSTGAISPQNSGVVEVEEIINNNDFADNAVFRFLNSDTGGYLYTVDETARDAIAQNQSNYQFENSTFAGVDSETEGAEEVYSFSNSDTGGTFYTTSEIERDSIVDNLEGFVFEDVAFSAFETEIGDSIPVYRFFDRNTGVHLYTGDESEQTFIANNLSNYTSEGIAFYALPAELDAM